MASCFLVFMVPFLVLPWMGAGGRGLSSPLVIAGEVPVLTLSALQFGTAHWVLENNQREGLDRQAGFLPDWRYPGG